MMTRNSRKSRKKPNKSQKTKERESEAARRAVRAHCQERARKRDSHLLQGSMIFKYIEGIVMIFHPQVVKFHPQTMKFHSQVVKFHPYPYDDSPKFFLDKNQIQTINQSLLQSYIEQYLSTNQTLFCVLIESRDFSTSYLPGDTPFPSTHTMRYMHIERQTANFCFFFKSKIFKQISPS